MTRCGHLYKYLIVGPANLESRLDGLDTMDLENRHDNFWITVSSSSVWYSPHVQESRTKNEKYFIWKNILSEKKFYPKNILSEKNCEINSFTSYLSYKIYWASRKYFLKIYFYSFIFIPLFNDVMTLLLFLLVGDWKNENFCSL